MNTVEVLEQILRLELYQRKLYINIQQQVLLIHNTLCLSSVSYIPTLLNPLTVQNNIQTLLASSNKQSLGLTSK